MGAGQSPFFLRPAAHSTCEIVAFGAAAALSQPCLPHLVPPLLDKPFLEANLDWRSISQAAEKDDRPSAPSRASRGGPRDPSSCRSEGSCPKQPDFMSRSPRGVQTTQGSDVGIGESQAGRGGLAAILTSGASLAEGNLLPPAFAPPRRCRGMNLGGG